MSRATQGINRWLLLAAILVGFGLRIYDLGGDSLWNDEAGQALAALQPTVAETLTFMQSHAAAMPLDYLVTRLLSSLSANEFVVRFPALFWSTIALALLVPLARWVGSVRVAIIAVYFMAVAPQLVYYAQEARPYAALLAFSLLSTYVLLRALYDGGMRRWLMWTFVTTVGAYFHLYVLLTALYGAAFAVLLLWRSPNVWPPHPVRSLFIFAGCLFLTLLLVMPGYLFFAMHDNYQYPLFQYGGDFWSVTVSGLGWPIERYPLYSMLLLALTVVGVEIAVISRHRDRRLMTLALGLPLIIVAIIVMDVIKGYWFVARQLIHLQPVVLIFAAIGCVVIGQQVARRRPEVNALRGFLAPVVTAAVVLTVFILWRPHLLERYEYQKGNGRAITDLVLMLPFPESVIFVQPPHEIDIYVYYATIADPTNSALISALRPAMWDDILGPVATPAARYLIAPPKDIAEHEADLRAAGYQPILEPPTNAGLVRSLWGRP